MKKEIKINNSRLKLVQYEDYEYGKTEIILRNKKSLRYQFILLTERLGDTGNPWLIMSTPGLNKVKLHPPVHTYSSAWGIEKSKELYTDEEYTTDELMIILSFVASTVYLEYLETTEILVQATKDKNIISKFYGMYGKEGIRLYTGFINNIICSKKYDVVESSDKFPKIYSNYNRYSISKLMSELIEDKADILVNPELIGEYKRISAKTIDKNSAFLRYKAEDWAKITGIKGNKSRANLSLCYDINVLVNIPENTVGITPGEKVYKSRQSICLVKDGLLNQSLVGVRISSKLAGKLKRLGVVRSELVYPGEYLIDISPLPVVTRCNIRDISSYYLSRLEVKYKLAVIANEYLQIYYPEEKKDISPKDNFLKELGIFGEYYIPIRERTGEKSYYNVTELTSTVSGLPVNKESRLSKYRSYNSKTSYHKDPIKVFLDSLGLDKRPIEEIRNEWKDKLVRYNNELRERKFQIIMSKTSRFNDKGLPLIEKTEKVVELTPEIKATVKWKFNQVTKEN